MRNVILEESIAYIDRIVNNNDKTIYNAAEMKEHWERVKRFATETSAAYEEYVKRKESGEYEDIEE